MMRSMIQVEVDKVGPVGEPNVPMHALRVVSGTRLGTHERVSFAVDWRQAADIEAAMHEGIVVAVIEPWQIVGLGSN